MRRNLANLYALAAIVRDVTLLFVADLAKRLNVQKENAAEDAASR